MIVPKTASERQGRACRVGIGVREALAGAGHFLPSVGAAIECQGEGVLEREKAGGPELVGEEVKVSEESENSAVTREKIEEHFFKIDS